MSLSSLLLAILLILLGLQWLGIFTAPAIILGLLALIAGIAIIIEGYRPIPLWKRD